MQSIYVLSQKYENYNNMFTISCSFLRGWRHSRVLCRFNSKHVGSIQVQAASCSPQLAAAPLLPLALAGPIGIMDWESGKRERESWQTLWPMCQHQAPTLQCLPQQQSLLQHLEQEVMGHNISWRCIYSDNVGTFECKRSTSLSVFFQISKYSCTKAPTDDCPRVYASFSWNSTWKPQVPCLQSSRESKEIL